LKQEILLALVKKIVDRSITDIQLSPGPRGLRGHAGLDGSNFDLSEHIESILASIPPLKLSEKQIEELTGRPGPEGDVGQDGSRGPRGYRGEDGNDFYLQDHIQNIIDALPPVELSEEQRQSLIGPRGKQGIGFLWEENSEEITSILNSYLIENKEDLKLKFSDLNEEEIFTLKGERGPRGQRGKSGDDGLKGTDGKDFSFEESR